MLRRSLLLFSGLCLLGLALTVGYALTGLSGPESAIREAEQAFALGQHAEAIRLLDTAERSAGLQRRPLLHARLLELRYRANRAVDNRRRALDDLEALIAIAPDRADRLQLERVFLLLRLDEADRADEAIRAYLAANPADPRGLELAGETRQARYRPRLRRAGSDLRRDLGPEDEGEGIRAMFSYLFRPPGDPYVDTAMDRLSELYSEDARLTLAWPQLREDLVALRTDVQAALDMYRRSLEQGGRPVAAYLNLADALVQAGRIDDQIALSEIYLLEFDHVYTQEAANRIAESHLAERRYRAVVELADRYLPPDAWRERYEAGRLDSRIATLLLLKARALVALDDMPQLGELTRMLEEMGDEGLPIALPAQYSIGVWHQHRGNWEAAERSLAVAARIYAGQPPPRQGADPLEEVMQRRLECAVARKATRSEFLALFEQWLQAAGRGGDATPMAERARYHQTVGEYRTAYTDAQAALRREPNRDDLLHLLAETADAFLAESGQDGETLLAHCLRQRIAVPFDLPSPVCLINVAEAALEAGHYGIARECARRAVDKFPWARRPRLQEVRAVRAMDRPQEAVDLLERMRRFHPADATVLVELRDARRAAGLPTHDLLFDLLRSAPPDARISADLLRHLLAHGGGPRLRAMAERVDARAVNTPELLGILCRAWLANGETARAAEVLERAGDGAPPNGALAVAAAELLVAQAGLDEQELLDRATDMLERFEFQGAEGAEALFDAAAELATADRPRVAYRLLERLLDQAEPDFPRSGKHYQLAGELALDIGWELLARQHWTAAIGFRDGGAAAEPLAVILSVDDEEARARQALAAHSTTPGPALALRLGDDDRALAGAAARLAEAPDDLIGLTVRDLAGGEHDAALGEGLGELDPADRQRLADALMLVANRIFPERAAEELAGLLERHPDLRVLDLLRARALLQAGHTEPGRAIHERLATVAEPDVLLVAEGVHATREHPEYRLPAALWQRLQALPTDRDVTLPEDLAAFLAQSLAHDAIRKGRPDLALDLLARLWRELPRASGAGIREAETLFGAGRTEEALELAYAIEESVDDSRRTVWLDSLFTIAMAVAPRDPDLAAPARSLAEREVADGRARGTAVHFLLAELEREHGELGAKPEIAAQARELLRGHIDAWKEGRDAGVRLLALTARRLADLAGLDEGLDACEEVLRKDPSLFDVWVLRAQLLARAGKAERALNGLRNLAAYLDDPDVAVARARLAARHGLAAAEELAYLEASIGESRGGGYRFARGMLALRAADYSEAERLLSDCTPADDGAHLYYRALANLVLANRNLPGDDAAALAEELFARIVEDYPSSSLARYSGSFARQLSR